MTCPAPVASPLLTWLIPWIEDHLDEPLSVDRIAHQAGLSPYHFSRVFTAAIGRSVMDYVRTRRLMRGARRLTADPGVKLVDMAADCGFESQEAFTRAFKRLFGVSPGRFRRGFDISPVQGHPAMTTSPIPATPAAPAVPVAQRPDLVHLDEFFVAGPSGRFDDDSKATIPRLWPRLMGALPFAGQVPSWTSYGVVSRVSASEGSFDYMAAVAVSPEGALPEGFTRLKIPAATYLVFRITLDGSALHPQIKSALATIWQALLPASGYRLRESPDFEAYDGRFAPDRPGAYIDYHVPVEA